MWSSLWCGSYKVPSNGATWRGRYHPGWRPCNGGLRPLSPLNAFSVLPGLAAAETWFARLRCLHMQTSISTSSIKAARHHPYLTASIFLASDHKSQATRRWPRRQRSSGKLTSKAYQKIPRESVPELRTRSLAGCLYLSMTSWDRNQKTFLAR